MQSRVIKFPSGSIKPTPSAGFYAQRLTIYEQELGLAEYTFADSAEPRIDIHAFGRDFVPDCEAGSDQGYALLTNGMSERRMPFPDRVGNNTRHRAELIWYVRKPTQKLCAMLRWLANLPFMDETGFGFGHRVCMPTPHVEGTDFKTFLFLKSIVRPEQRMAEALQVAGDPVEILTVNLISDQELALIKAGGLKAFLDLLDENHYPAIFDPSRPSYV